MSSSVHANNKTRSNLDLGKDFIQAIDSTTIYAEKMYSINFTVDNKKVCLSLHFNGDDSYLFVNGKKFIKFRAKDSEIVEIPIRLRNISKDSKNNMPLTGLNGYVYDFSFGYRALAALARHS